MALQPHLFMVVFLWSQTRVILTHKDRMIKFGFQEIAEESQAQNQVDKNEIIESIRSHSQVSPCPLLSCKDKDAWLLPRFKGRYRQNKPRSIFWKEWSLTLT